MFVQQYEVNQNLGKKACKPGSDGLPRPFHSNMCLCFLAFVLAHSLPVCLKLLAGLCTPAQHFVLDIVILHFCIVLLSSASCRRCCPSLLTIDQRNVFWLVANYNRECALGRVTQFPYLYGKLSGKGLASGWSEKLLRLRNAHCKAGNSNCGYAYQFFCREFIPL